MMPGRPASIVRLAGWAIAAVSLVFVVVVAGRRWAEIDAIDLQPGQWLRIGGLALFYGLSLFLLAGAWHLLLLLVGAAPARPSRSVYAHATSQLAKYVPGNVFHYFGRHMMLRGDGLPDRRLALASLIEVGLMLSSAGVIVLLAIAIDPPPALLPLIDPHGSWHLPGLVLAAALVAAAALGVAVWLAGGRLAWATAALGIYCLFFVLMGGILAVIAAMVAESSPLAAAGGGIAAWMAGFVTPGAPAGLGTREAAMLLFVGGQVPPGALVVIAALFRLVTFVGDLVCFALGQLLARER